MNKFLLFVLFSALFASPVLSLNFSSFMTASSAYYNLSESFKIQVPYPNTIDNVSLVISPQLSSFSQRLLSYSFHSYPEAKQHASHDKYVVVWHHPSESILSAQYSFSVQKTIPKMTNISYPLPVFYAMIRTNSSLTKYLSRTSKYDFDDSFKSLASEIIGNSSDEFSAVSKIVLWVNHHMTYDLKLRDKNWSASRILAVRRGVCSHYSTLTVALLRSVGIPAREVSGFAYSNLPKYNSFVAHSWIEVFFPGVGWVQFDPTYAEVGWVDVSHLRTNLSSYVSWHSYSHTDVDFLGRNSSVGLIYYTNGSPKLNLSMHFFKDSVGLDSYNLVYVTVKNFLPFYTGYCFNISETQNIKVLSNRRVCVFLKPLESKNISWVVKPFGLDKMYGYTFPIYVYNSLSDVESSFHAVATSPNYPVSDVLSFKDKIDSSEKGVYFPQRFVVSCSPKFLYPYNKHIFCNVTNFGPRVADFKICLSDQCYSSKLFLYSSKVFVFDSNSSSYKLVISSLKPGLYSYSYDLNISRLNYPEINFSASLFNETNEFVILNFSISSVGVSNSSLRVYVNNQSVSYFINGSKLFIPKYYFSNGENLVNFNVSFSDFNDRHYSKLESVRIQVKIPFWLKFKLLFRRLLLFLESLF